MISSLKLTAHLRNQTSSKKGVRDIKDKRDNKWMNHMKIESVDGGNITN